MTEGDVMTAMMFVIAFIFIAFLFGRALTKYPSEDEMIRLLVDIRTERAMRMISQDEVEREINRNVEVRVKA